MRCNALLALCLSAAIGLAPSAASAQRRRPRNVDRPRPSASASPASAAGYALTNKLGPASALRLLASSRREDRLLGVQRLAGQNDFAAVQLLLQATQDNPAPLADPVVKLQVVRALAPFASRDAVRRTLAAWVVGDASRLRPASGLARDVQLAAALALAASNDTRAVDQLVSFVIAGDDAGQIAAEALEAHPPQSIDSLLRGKAASSPGVLRLLGRLGDLRALPVLRNALGDTDPAVASEAALALARLGDDAVAPIARSWINSPTASASTRLAAARALVLVRAADAPRAMAILIADPATRLGGLRLAYDAPTPQLSATLAGFLTIATGQARSLALAALSRSGGPLAVRTLQALVTRPTADLDAAMALARCPSPEALDVIDSLLGAPATRLLGARMAIARLALTGDTARDLDDTLRSMLASPALADRQSAAFGLVLAGWEPVSSFSASADPPIVAAACRATYARTSRDRATCAALLSERSSPFLRDALGISLSDPAVASSWSTRLLLGWSESFGSSAPIFARLLGGRDTALVRPSLELLLRSGDAVFRAQVALGLADSPDPSAASLLIDAFQSEEDPLVRRAIVRALSHLPSVHSKPVLADAARLDPDPQVRSLSALAARSVALPLAPHGSSVVWLQVRGTVPGAQRGRSVRLALPDGFALSSVCDDDGFLMIPGVPSDQVRLTVASSAESGQPAGP